MIWAVVAISAALLIAGAYAIGRVNGMATRMEDYEDELDILLAESRGAEKARREAEALLSRFKLKVASEIHKQLEDPGNRGAMIDSLKRAREALREEGIDVGPK